MAHFLLRGYVQSKPEDVLMPLFVRTSVLIWDHLKELSNFYKADILLCESGGGGDKIPLKGGPGITQADLLVINKTNLAAAVGADLAVMERDALEMWDGGPSQVKHRQGVDNIVLTTSCRLGGGNWEETALITDPSFKGNQSAT